MATQSLASSNLVKGSTSDYTTSHPSSASGVPVSPPNKRKCKAFSDTEKMMVNNVYKYVFDEKYKEEKRDQDLPDVYKIRVNKNECVLKTAEILGISKASVYRILKEHKESDVFSPPNKTGPKLNFKDKIDELTFCAIRHKVLAFLHNNETPTIAKVLQAVNNDDELPNFSLTTMAKILKHLNFKYKNKTWTVSTKDIPEKSIGRYQHADTARILGS